MIEFTLLTTSKVHNFGGQWKWNANESGVIIAAVGLNQEIKGAGKNLNLIPNFICLREKKIEPKAV